MDTYSLQVVNRFAMAIGMILFKDGWRVHDLKLKPGQGDGKKGIVLTKRCSAGRSLQVPGVLTE